MKRTWIKLWVDQCLRGSMIEELSPEQRWIFIGILLMGGDSEIPGVVFRRKNEYGAQVGYSNAVLADTLGVEHGSIKGALARMVDKAKISIDGNGVISICNWTKYQSEYERQRGGRTKVRPGAADKCGLDLDRERDRDREEEKDDHSFNSSFEEFWKGYPKKIAKDYAREKFMILARAGKIPELMKATKGYMDFLKHRLIHENFKQEPLYPATFLMKDRWRDYIEVEYKPPM